MIAMFAAIAELFFSAIAATTVIVGIISKPGLKVPSLRACLRGGGDPRQVGVNHLHVNRPLVATNQDTVECACFI